MSGSAHEAADVLVRAVFKFRLHPEPTWIGDHEALRAIASDLRDISERWGPDGIDWPEVIRIFQSVSGSGGVK